jgi:hypothetical protein
MLVRTKFLQPDVEFSHQIYINFFSSFKNKTLSLSLSFSPAGEEARDGGIWKAGGIRLTVRDARPDLGGFLVGSGFGSGRMVGSGRFGIWTAWFFGRIWVSGWISQTHADMRGFRPDLSRAQLPPVHGVRKWMLGRKWTLGGDCLGGGCAGVFRGGRFVFRGGGAGWFGVGGSGHRSSLCA